MERPGVRDVSDDEWDDDVRSGRASSPPRPMNNNVGQQSLFENVNAIPSIIVLPASKARGACRAKQQNLEDMATNWKDVELDDHVVKAVRQTQSIVENMQAEADSMQDHERMVAEVVASRPENPPDTLERSDGATGLEDTPLDALHALHLIDVLLSCHPLFRGSSVTKLAAIMLIMTICIMHKVNNKFVDELLYLLHKYILPQRNSLSFNMYHAKVLVEEVGHNYESIHACKNGCVLFQGDVYTNMAKYLVCNAN